MGAIKKTVLSRFQIDSNTNQLYRLSEIPWEMLDMAAITLKAHFDGEHIMLDEPHELQPGMAVTVMVAADANDMEKLDWARAASESLERAYSDNEPEYTTKDVKP